MQNSANDLPLCWLFSPSHHTEEGVEKKISHLALFEALVLIHSADLSKLYLYKIDECLEIVALPIFALWLYMSGK